MTHRVSAVLGDGVAAMRNISPVAPEARAARVSLRLATRSNARTSPQTSSTTVPSASQANASAATRSAISASVARTVTTCRGSRPSSASPLIDSAPHSISVKSCLTHSSGRRADTRRARPATKPAAAALCRPPSANTSCIAPRTNPPWSAASASACPNAARPSAGSPAPASRRSIVSRKLASMLTRAPVMRRSWKSGPVTMLEQRLTALFVHVMFLYKSGTRPEVNCGGRPHFHHYEQGDARNTDRV